MTISIPEGAVWRHCRWAEPHPAKPDLGCAYRQPGTQQVETRCETCGEAVVIPGSGAWRWGDDDAHS